MMMVQAANQNGASPNSAIITEDFRTLVFQQTSIDQFSVATVYLAEVDNQVQMVGTLHAALPHPAAIRLNQDLAQRRQNPIAKKRHLSIVK